MTITECLDSGIIYRNPKLYLRSLHAYFPSVVVLPNGDIFIAFWCVEECVSNID